VLKKLLICCGAVLKPTKPYAGFVLVGWAILIFLVGGEGGLVAGLAGWYDAVRIYSGLKHGC